GQASNMNAAGIRGRSTCLWPCREIASAACRTRSRAAPATRPLPTTGCCWAIQEGSDLRRYRGVQPRAEILTLSLSKGKDPRMALLRFYRETPLCFLVRIQSPARAAGAISTWLGTIGMASESVLGGP